ncbi:SufE family protein [bacterium]|nr:SufE family protein [bacterium]
MAQPSAPLPDRLQRIVTLFAASPRQVKLDALVDYSRRLPPLPDDIDRAEMERVQECQSPLYVATSIGTDGTVRLYLDAPMESSATRGFAGIVSLGLEGLPADEILGVPDDFYAAMGLAEVVTPMRMRGMHSILRTIKRQITEARASSD